MSMRFDWPKDICSLIQIPSIISSHGWAIHDRLSAETVSKTGAWDNGWTVLILSRSLVSTNKTSYRPSKHCSWFEFLILMTLDQRVSKVFEMLL